MSMKKGIISRGLAVVLTTAMAMGVVLTPGFAQTARAAGTNVSIATAEEVTEGTFKEGLIEKGETNRERWYKFTNNTGSDAAFEVTITGKAGTDWSHYYFFDGKGKGEDESGLVTGLSKVFVLGINKGETKYLKIENTDVNKTAGWTTSVSFTAEETNGFNGLKTIKSGKTIYGKIDYKKDVDTYKIKAKKSGTMTIKITNNNIDGLLAKFEYTVFNKSKAAKAKGIVKVANTGKVKIKVKKGQCVYVQVGGRDLGDKSLGDYVIKTKIK